MNQKNKGKALESALSQIEKQFGKGSLMKLGEDSVDPVSYTHLTLPTKA